MTFYLHSIHASHDVDCLVAGQYQEWGRLPNCCQRLTDAGGFWNRLGNGATGEETVCSVWHEQDGATGLQINWNDDWKSSCALSIFGHKTGSRSSSSNQCWKCKWLAETSLRKYVAYSSLSMGCRTRSEYMAERFSKRSPMACAEFKMIMVLPNWLIEMISLSGIVQWRTSMVMSLLSEDCKLTILLAPVSVCYPRTFLLFVKKVHSNQRQRFGTRGWWQTTPKWSFPISRDSDRNC